MSKIKETLEGLSSTIKGCKVKSCEKKYIPRHAPQEDHKCQLIAIILSIEPAWGRITISRSMIDDFRARNCPNADEVEELFFGTKPEHHGVTDG